MTLQRSNVLLFDHLPTRNLLRAAMAKIIRSIQSEHGETDEATADKLCVSVGTIANVRNERTDLNAVTIARIGAIYGEQVLDPYAALYGARNVPIDADKTVSLHAITGAVHKLALATAPESESGPSVSHNELADMLPDLRGALRVINGLLARADKLGIAA